MWLQKSIKHMHIRQERGFITVEAAIVVPLFMTFCFLLSSFWIWAHIELQLERAVSDTADRLSQGYSAIKEGNRHLSIPLTGEWQNWHSILPEASNLIEDAAALLLVQHWLRLHPDISTWELERIHIQKLHVPNQAEETQDLPHVILTVCYTWKLLIPFVQQWLTNCQTAKRAVWGPVQNNAGIRSMT